MLPKGHGAIGWSKQAIRCGVSSYQFRQKSLKRFGASAV
jgi:hypothetical protein